MAFTTSWFRQASLYKFRYILGYGFIVALLLFVVTADIGRLPDGLSQVEMNQATLSTSMTYGLNTNWLINAPYNAIQKISVETLGLSRLSLVLPSLIFGTATIIMFILTMKHWFRDTVAIVATVISMSSVPFMMMLRSGTPEIMLPFWTMLLLYGAVRLLVKREHAFHWKLLIMGATIGLLYTPYGTYPLIAIFGSALFHPHVRSRLRHIRRSRIIVLLLLLVAGVAPLAVHLFRSPQDINLLTGLDTIKASLLHIRENLSVLFDMYFNLRKNGFSGTQIVPLFNVATLALIIFGVLKSIKDKHTARSYVLLSWAILTAITAIFMPFAIVLTFVPAVLLVAIGINALVLEWYSLFPRNPYARVAGLIPLTILFLGIGLGNISHYFNNYNHIPNAFYSRSLPAIQKALVVEGDHAVILVTTPEELSFYKILQKQHRFLTVTTSLPANTEVPTLILPNVEKTFDAMPSRIITTATKDDSIALRVYRPQ